MVKRQLVIIHIYVNTGSKNIAMWYFIITYFVGEENLLISALSCKPIAI